MVLQVQRLKALSERFASASPFAPLLGGTPRAAYTCNDDRSVRRDRGTVRL